MDEDEPFTGEWVLNAKSYPSIFDLGGKFNPDTFTQCPGGTLQGVCGELLIIVWIPTLNRLVNEGNLPYPTPP